MSEVTARVYLETEKVTESEGFETRPNNSKAYHGETLYYESAKLSFVDWPLNRKCPDDMKPLVVFVSIKIDFLHEFTEREIGVYEDPGQFDNCRAVLDIGYEGRVDARYLVYELNIRGTDLENLRKLYEAIRGGTIRPAISYSGPHGGKSRAELEQEITKLRHEIAELKQRVLDLEADRIEQNEKLAVIRKACGGIVTIHLYIAEAMRLQRKKGMLQSSIRQACRAVEDVTHKLAEAGISIRATTN